MTFSEVTGQVHVVKTLTNTLMSGRAAHAYLFSGMRGVGKTTMARILAKALNCDKGTTPTPCLTCASCREIGSGTSFDVMEIDGASSNSVDDVREMRETIKTGPARGRYRVYIIDEVHMLSTPAFNALLKTLEEPPSHVVFVFATTESHKIPQTILSRCQHFTFRRIPRREIIDTLQRVATAEGVTIDERSLSALARASDGSMRDALSLMDQAVAFSGKRVAENDLMTLLGSVPHELLRGVLDAALARDAAGALRSLAAVQDYGCDVRRFAGELMEYVRNLLVAKVVADAEDLIALGPDEQAEITLAAGRLSLDHIQELFRVFLEAEDGIRTSRHPWYVVEMAMVKACRVGSDQPGSASTRPVAKAPASLASTPAKAAPLPVRSAAPPAPKSVVPQPVQAAIQAPAETSEESAVPSRARGAVEDGASWRAGGARVPADESERPAQPARARGAGASEAALAAARVPADKLAWEDVVMRVQAERPNIGSYLEQSTLVSLGDDVVTIGFPPSASAAMNIVQQAASQQAVADVCVALLGRPVHLRLITVVGETATPTVAEIRHDREVKTERHLRDEALAHPIIKETLSVFGGELKEVRRNPSMSEHASKGDGHVQ